MQMLHRLRGQYVAQGGGDAAARGRCQLSGQRLREQAVRRVGRLVLRHQQHRLHQNVDRAALQGPRPRRRHRGDSREQEPAGRRQVQADTSADHRQRQGHGEEQDRRDARHRRQEDDTCHEPVRVYAYVIALRWSGGFIELWVCV